MTDERDTVADMVALSSREDPDAPLPFCDGLGLKRLMGFGLAWLERHQEAINALNVYPVPDGDTGTNMLLTMQSAYQEIHRFAGGGSGRHSPKDRARRPDGRAR